MSALGLLVTPAERVTVRLTDYTRPTRIRQEQQGDTTVVHAHYTCPAQARAAALAIGSGSTIGQPMPLRVPVDAHTVVVLHDRPRGLHRRELFR